ncbi:hypothetical protein CG709_01605 [Lachnotalea glycerini]|nr:hypothetical protein CG709_01605 [Lachnotalea glycerini]
MDYRNYMPFGYGQIPFYSGFRYSLDSSQEMIMEKDKEYMKSLYPVKAKEIQALVEDECDKLEYEGSIMFDEYPDKIGLRKIGMDVYNKISKNEAVVDAKEESKEEETYRMKERKHHRQQNFLVLRLKEFMM